MYKLLNLLFTLGIALLIFGCSSEQPTQPASSASSPGVDHSITLVERPQFIETRPPEVVASFTLTLADVPHEIAAKKPPKPPPEARHPQASAETVQKW